MKWTLLATILACSPLVLSWRNQSGVRIGTGRGSQPSSLPGTGRGSVLSGRGGSGIRLGQGTRNITTTPTTPPTIIPSTTEQISSQHTYSTTPSHVLQVILNF